MNHLRPVGNPLFEDTGSLSVPKDLQSPEPSGSGRWVALAATVLGAALALGGTWVLGAGLDVEDEAALANAQSTLRVLMDKEQRDSAAIARVIADDTRVRTLLATPGIDGATVVDVLQDIKQAAGISIVGVVSAEGQIQAVVGSEALKSTELGQSTLFKSAQSASEKTTAGLWAFADQLLNVAFAPIRLGSDVVAYILVARPANVRAVDDRLSSAVVVRGQLAVGSSPAFKQAFDQMTAAQTNLLRSGDSVFQLSSLEDQSHSSQIVWAVARRHAASQFGFVTPILWGLFVLLVLVSGFLVWSERSQA